jgi:isopentenyldiphosphate isomerase
MTQQVKFEFIEMRYEDWSPSGVAFSRTKLKELNRHDRDYIAKHGFIWHLAAHVWVVNPQGEILFQQRSINNRNFPGMWDISAAGHVLANETVIQGAIREAKEELGLVIQPYQLAEIHRANSTSGNHHLHTVFVCLLDVKLDELKFLDGEVENARYIHWHDLAQMTDAELAEQNILNHKKEFEALIKWCRERFVPMKLKKAA